jgi:hypothetical protein
MTMLLDEGHALVLRCDECRRIWPVSRRLLDAGVWVWDTERDRHTCPVCSRPPMPDGHPAAALSARRGV